MTDLLYVVSGHDVFCVDVESALDFCDIADHPSGVVLIDIWSAADDRHGLPSSDLLVERLTGDPDHFSWQDADHIAADGTVAAAAEALLDAIADARLDRWPDRLIGTHAYRLDTASGEWRWAGASRVQR